MNNPSVDLYSLPFWAVVAAAILVLTPLKAARARELSFAAINLGFLALYLRGGVAWVMAGVLVAWLALKLVARHGTAPLALGAFSAAVVALFVAHKLPGLAARSGLGPLNPILTFAGFSYVALRLIDVALAVRDGRHAPPDLTALVNYALPFHMLAAGPVQSYDDFAGQPGVPAAPGPARALEGFERIASGLFKKYVLANLIHELFLTDFRAGGAYALLELQANYLWLYLDFSAYSDIALGVGSLMGIATPENFRRPYLARNVVEFWERWHISLSLFIRRNVFTPVQIALMRLTDGRRPLLVASLAFSVSFLLCGLWHSLSWPWLAWGAFQASGLIACNAYKAALLRKLGRKGLNRYLARPWVHALAVIVTFEFSAIAVAIVTIPCENLPWPTESRTR
jgi:D-alanyl-lipoteichoic acid acyltransferase DltB (MBOAT superfamily)